LATPLPNLFFSRVLPDIESAEELTVSVYFFFLQARTRGASKFVARRELEADAGLIRSLSNLSSGDGQAALERGLELAVKRMTLARTHARRGDCLEEVFAVNTPSNRAALASLRALEPGREPLPPATGSTAPGIFALYEENVGPLTPLIADDLKDAEERYPAPWIHDAFSEAIGLNKRSWRYIERILRRWEAEGRGDEKSGRDTQVDWLERRYVAGKRRLEPKRG